MRMLMLALAGALLLGGAAFGQAIDPAEIERRIEEGIAQLPDREVAVEGVLKLTYKAVPGELSRLLPPGTVPAGMEGLEKQYGHMAAPYVNKYMGKIGTLTLEKQLKLSRKVAIDPGDYEFGLLFQELKPVGFVLKLIPEEDAEGEEAEEEAKPIQIPFKKAQPLKEDADLEFVFDAKKSGKEVKKLSILVKFRKDLGGVGVFKVYEVEEGEEEKG